jgi:DNA polymerase-3 subunit gamma/tau
VSRDLEARARELLLVASLGEVPTELSLTPDADRALSEQAQRCLPAAIVRLLELLGEAMEGVRAGAEPRTRLELALVKAARPALDGSHAALLARIERLEAGAPQAQQSAPAPEPPTDSAAAAAPEAAGEREPAEAQVPPADAPAPAAAPPQSGDLETMRALWPAVVDLVRAENAMLGAIVEVAQPVHASDGELTLAFASAAQFYRKKAEDPAHRALLGEALRSLTGTRWRLSFELRQVAGAGPGEEGEEPSEEELLRRFIEEFDAEEIPGDGQSQAAEPEGEHDADARAHAATSNEKAS